MNANARTSADVEAAFAIELPEEIREAVDAVTRTFDEHGEPLCWSAAVLIEQNKVMRTTETFSQLYMPFDHLLFFGAAGDGDLFAVAIDADGTIRRDDVFVWRHETDSRQWFARNFAAYVAARREAP